VKIRLTITARFLLVFLLAVPMLFHGTYVRAAELDTRSLQTTSSIALAITNHVFTYNVPSTSTLGSIEFEYCSNSPFIGTACTAPAGLDLSGIILTSQTTNTGFSVDILNSTANKIALTRAAVNGTLGTSSYTFANIVNPSTPNETVYVRISHYGSTDTSGPRGDNGAVAFSISGGFNVGGYVPPYLVFCAAITVSLDCTTTTGSLISFGELLSTQTKASTSQFSGATNDPTGYSVSLTGQTMTAGNLIIPPLSSNSGSIVGSGQFGINLRSNTVPVVGAEPSGAGTAFVNGVYNIPNQYRFVNGEQLVNSTLPTDYNLHTVSYIVNVSSAQQPGYYATTMTFIATAAF
jgi:hypothetical protein